MMIYPSFRAGRKLRNFRREIVVTFHRIFRKLKACHCASFTVVTLLTFTVIWFVCNAASLAHILIVTSSNYSSELESQSQLKIDVETATEEAAAAADISLKVIRDVRLPVCEILSIVRDDIEYFSRNKKNNLICTPRESMTNVIDLSSGYAIIRKTERPNCITCCYKPIYYRNGIRSISNTCYRFAILKPIIDDTIQMIQTNCNDLCGDIMSEESMTTFTAFHPGKISVTNTTSRKITYWENWRGKGLHVTKKEMKFMKIILINIESLSRHEAPVILPKTLKRLEDSGYLEMKGFSHISEEAATNFLASLIGLSGKNWDEVCSFSETGYLDECPFIWKRLNGLGYITTYAQDAHIFNAAKIRNYQHQQQFHNAPVDYFLSHRTYESLFPKECKNSYQVNLMLEYSHRIIRKFSNYPVFSMTRITNPNKTHVEIDLDFKLLNFFRNIEDLLESSFVAFYSNSGSSGSELGRNRNLAGTRKMDSIVNHIKPFLFIRIPEKPVGIMNYFQNNLKLNAERLTTMYDLHGTLQHLARMTCNRTNIKSVAEFGCSDNFRLEYEDSSLLLPISSRLNCSDALIDEEVCPCNLDLNSEKSVSKALQSQMVDVALYKLNSMIPNLNLCSEFILHSVLDVILIKTSKDNIIDFSVRINVNVRSKGKIELKTKGMMEVHQKIRINTQTMILKTIGPPSWASSRGDGHKCLYFSVDPTSSAFLLQKSFCFCKHHA